MTTSTKTTTKKPAAKKAPAKKPATRRKSVPVTSTTGDASAPLEALVGDLPTGPRLVDADRLVPHPRNPRTAMDEDDLQQLADSIRAQGVRQNLLVVPDPGEEGRHMIVIGHRRALAARMAGLAQVPAIVDPTLTEAQQLELMLVENIQRSDLTVVEEADGFQGLLDLGMTRAEMAKSTGVSRTKVSSRLKLAALPPVAKGKVAAGRATLEDVDRLTQFEDDPELHAQLMAELGGSAFSWKIQQEETRREVAKKREGYRARLEELGTPIVDSYSQIPPTAQHYRGSWPSRRVSDEDVKADGVYALTRGYSAEYDIYGPPTAGEAESDADRAEREAREKAEAEALQAVQTATDLRTAFLLERTTGKAKLAADHAGLVTDAYVRLQLDDELRTPHDLEVVNVLRWLGSDATDLAGRPPAQVLLALAAAAIEEDPEDEAHGGFRWNNGIRTVYTAHEEGWSKVPYITAWYALLSQLGYEPSQWEQDRLAGVPLVEGEGEPA